MRYPLSLLLVAIVGCASGQGGAGTAAPAGGGDTAAGSTECGPLLFRYGEPVQRDERPGICCATREQVEACGARDPTGRCEMRPQPSHWRSPFDCQGVDHGMRGEQLVEQHYAELTMPECMCSCTDAYRYAADEEKRRREACANVP